jgi:hypothetical protein
MTILLSCGCALGVGTLLVFPKAEAAEKVTLLTDNQKIKVWRIDQPNIRQRVTDYKQICFQPGDVITIEAGGCCQTGGLGNTWKRYVDPQGPNSERLYTGMIWIPGVPQTQGLQPLRGVLKEVKDSKDKRWSNTFQITEKVDPDLLYLRLGYVDDDYSDNGYWGRDDGTGDQCKGLSNAFVIVTIHRGDGVKPPTGDPHAPLDLVWDQVDDNWIPKNPRWYWQVAHQGKPDSIPDADKLGHDFRATEAGVDRGNPPFTTQAISTDTASGWNSIWCAVGGHGDKLRGHLNWMAATYEGTIYWESHSSPGADDDYNFRLVPPNQEGLVTANHGSLGLEFDSDETIDHFHTPWWSKFHQAVDDDNRKAKALVDGKFAIVTGLLGLDCEHSSATELHPVYAMAIRVAEDPADETWAMFVRNLGNEGYCSQDLHALDLLDHSYTFRLPWRPGATSVRVKQQTFLTNNKEVTGPDVTWEVNREVSVRFHLPDPEAGARVNGELHLEWVGTALKPHTHVMLKLPARPAPDLKEASAEKRLADIYAKMTPDQRKTLHEHLAKIHEPIRKEAHMLPVKPTHEPKRVERLAVLSVHAQHPPHVRSIHDPNRAAKDQARYEALRKILGDKMPAVKAHEHVPITPPPASTLGIKPVEGVLIGALDPNGAAAKAGLKDGDRIVEVADKPVKDLTAFLALLKEQKKGATVRVTVIRDQKKMTIQVVP